MWLWMTLVDPWPEGDGALLYAFRLLFRSAMVGSIVLGYALGLNAGTQVVTLGVGEVIAGPPSEISRALLMGAAWLINLAVAEWAIRKRLVLRARTSAAVAQLH